MALTELQVEVSAFADAAAEAMRRLAPPVLPAEAMAAAAVGMAPQGRLRSLLQDAPGNTSEKRAKSKEAQGAGRPSPGRSGWQRPGRQHAQPQCAQPLVGACLGGHFSPANAREACL